MLQYQISTHTLWINGVKQAGNKFMPYSGHGAGLNNPAAQDQKGVGPILCGLWRLTAWVDHPHLGRKVTHLLPIKVNPDYGRSGFFIHGDNNLRNFTASDGCIILDEYLRDAIIRSGETQLLVIA